MKFRYQAFDDNKRLFRGTLLARNEREAREVLEAMYPWVVQLDAMWGGGEPGPGSAVDRLTTVPSEQFIRENPPRTVALRTDSGMQERRLLGHLEMLGPKEYVQLWSCIAIYVLTALVMWNVYPPLRELNPADWAETKDASATERYNPPWMKAAIVSMANSAATLLALFITLALKQPLPRIGLTLTLVYAVQWLIFALLPSADAGPKGAVRFLAGNPAYALAAWLLPAVLMIGTERFLRHALRMTVPVYEDPLTGGIELGGRDAERL